MSLQPHGDMDLPAKFPRGKPLVPGVCLPVLSTPKVKAMKDSPRLWIWTPVLAPGSKVKQRSGLFSLLETGPFSFGGFKWKTSSAWSLESPSSETTHKTTDKMLAEGLLSQGPLWNFVLRQSVGGGSHDEKCTSFGVQAGCEFGLL